MIKSSIYPWEGRFYDPLLFEAGAGDADSQRSADFYLDALGITPIRVVDCGCGTGRLAIALLERGHEVLGVDSSSEMLSKLREKAMELPEEARDRLQIIEGDFCATQPTGTYDAVIAPDDFSTHFLNLDDLGDFFAQAGAWVRPGGLLLTDLRVRDEARLADASSGWPKPLKTFGIVECKPDPHGCQHVCMNFWEEYDSEKNLLTCNQIFKYIDNEGVLARTVFKVIRQRVHSHIDLVEAARRAGFRLSAVYDRDDPGRLVLNPSGGGFYRFEASLDPIVKRADP